MSDVNSADYWIKTLKLEPHPTEGGYYCITFKSEENTNDLPARYKDGSCRNFATNIYYLLKRNDFAAWHRMNSDVVWSFHHGSPITIFIINDKTGELETRNLGPGQDHHFMTTLKHGNWFASRLLDPVEGSFALLSCFVCPGFDIDDIEIPTRVGLITKYPNHRKLIEEMTFDGK